MRLLPNPRPTIRLDAPFPSTDVAAVEARLKRCPAHAETPLVSAPFLASRAGVAEVLVKDERGRMGLGSFKALGAAYVIARDHERDREEGRKDGMGGRTYVTASAGNHGLSVAAGARVFGARAVVHVAETVPLDFVGRLEAEGATVRREGADYEAAMALAAAAAGSNGWHLLSDSSRDGYTDAPHRLMEGYLVLMEEAVRAMEPPTHVFLQAGVGGLAAACAALARHRWGASADGGPTIVVVEPEAAPALHDSVAAGRVVETRGPVSAMGRLDCKVPSWIALKGLARDADHFALVSEGEGEAALAPLDAAGLATTPSGGAGIAALLAAGPHRDALGLDETSRVLAIVSEAP